MTGGQAIRGTRVGSGPVGEAERGVDAEGVDVDYHCHNRHTTTIRFSVEAGGEVPETWDCVRCGLPAGEDADNPPEPPSITPYKTHLDYVKERRDDAQGETLLEEALQKLREQRGTA
uniref:RNA polymerase-binding protein RbpA n=1 Tax=Kytococcus aerolatus TaxID=592308 RepID=UPI00190EFC43|nr:RNA polymerase-binding protein RbpA [Kytococcus aerolatus]